MSEPLKPIEYAAEPEREARSCPQCGHALRRMRRSDADRERPDGVRTHRFQCRSEACDWEGLLAVSRERRRLRVRRRVPRAATPVAKSVGMGVFMRALLVAALAIGVPAVVVIAASLGLRLDRQSSLRVPAGESHDGRALPLQHPLRQPVGGELLPSSAEVETPLTLRQGCAWGQPGRNPYRGSTEQALRQARLPAEVVSDIVARRARKAVSDRLEIRTGSIRTVKDGRDFNPRSFAMSFGHTLCLNTRVNFAKDHVEMADLYEAQDHQGRRYAVMVPDVCGNVSVLGERGERAPGAPLVNASAAALAPLPWLQAGSGEQGDGFGLSHALAVLGNSNEVPEPGSLGLVLAALAGAWALGRRRR